MSRVPVHIIIYGQHSPGWMAALGPQSLVWQGITEAETVTVCLTPAEAFAQSRNAPGAHVLIPIMEKHIVSRPANFFEFSPTVEAVDILSDKKKFAVYARRHGLCAYIPETYWYPEDIRFPCVIKRTNLNAGTGIERVYNHAHLDELVKNRLWAGHDYILQAFLPDTMEYCSHLVCRAGHIIWDRSFAYTINETLPIRGSGQDRAAPAPMTFTPAPHILTQIEAFLVPLAFDGPCNVDYKIGMDGNIRVLEINPRLGGTLMAGSNRLHLEALLRCIIANATATPNQAAA